MRLAVALVCLIAPTVRAQTADSVAWGLPAWWSTDEQTEFLHWEATVAGLFGLDPLATSPLPEGVREIRIRKASSLFDPLFVLRIVDDHGSVTDTGWLWWDAESDSSLTPYMSSVCAELRPDPARTICTGHRMARADTLLASFGRLRVWTLPGDPPDPPGALIVRGDGETFVVELRDGTRYRAYSYWSPQRTQEPHEAAAAEMAEIAGRRVWAMAQP